MGRALAWLGETHGAVEGHAAPAFGLVAAVGVTAPLIVGAITGRVPDGVLVALGAFYVAFTTSEGPYGARARSLLLTTGVVGAGTLFGELMGGHPWEAVAVVPVVAATGAAVPWIGATFGLTVVVGAIRPPTHHVLLDSLLELAGGLWMTGLFLAPWVTCRLRPLRDSLAAAAMSVAALLDVLHDPEADEDEWEQRRRTALETIEAARTTYALYRTGGGDAARRPKRLLDALSRISAEAVTLHALQKALRPQDEAWERECRVALSALAARVRLLAAAIASGGRTPLGRPESRALSRFGRVTEDLRLAALDGRGDLVQSALTGQVRRRVERMWATIDRAAQIVERGLTFGIELPGIPDAPEPRALADRVRGAIVTRSPGLRHAARIGVATAISMALATGLHLKYGHWLTITVMISLRRSYGETVTRVVKRVGGTAIGGTVAALALAVAPGQITLITLMFCCGVTGFALRSKNYSYWMIFGTPMIMMLVDFAQPLDWTAAGERIALTLAGGTLALAAARLLWPAGGEARLPEALAGMLNAHAELARSGATTELTEQADRAARDVSDLVTRLSHEPGAPLDKVNRIRTGLRAAARVRDDLTTVATLDDDDADSGPIPEILDRVAGHLDQGADALLAGEPDDESLDLGDLLGDLDEHLSTLAKRRRSEIAEGVATDELTPLRRGLLQTAALRHALRALSSDADDLFCYLVPAPSPEYVSAPDSE